MTTQVNDRSKAVEKMSANWALAAALLGGTAAMREAGQTYLPRWPKEDADAYAVRLKNSVLFPAYSRTVKTLAGKPFSKPITVGDDVPSRIKEWMTDIDLEGRNLDAFASDIMESAVGYGLAGILVEYPKVNPGEVRTEAQERSAGLRPYWVEIKPKQILGWRAARVSGEWQLQQLRLMECVEEPDGNFGVAEIEQVRVLEPGRWATYRYASDGAEWVLYENGTTSLSIIPFVPVYGGRTGFMTAVPPLLELAHLNVAHWQSASDQQNILHVARVPILTVTGIEDDKWTMTVGSSSAIRLPADSEMKYVEHTGSAIEAGQEDLNKLEERMRQAGAELLVIAPGYVTATQINTENAVGMCVLQRITQGFEDSLDQALQITADWIKESTGGHVTIYNDYGAATLQEASAQLLLTANQAGKLSDETLHSEFQRRGILAADMSWEDEKARLEEQGPELGMMGNPTNQQNQNDPTLGSITAPQPQTAPPFDMGALASAIATAIGGIQFPTPIVNIAAAEPPPPAQITVEGPTINVQVPEQPPPQVTVNNEAPVVNVAAPDITVTMPEQKAPIVNVEAPVVNVTPPNVTVTVEKPTGIKFTEDDNGNITGANLQ